MRENFAKIILFLSVLTAVISTFFLIQKRDPFYTLYYLFIWWSIIGMIDSWLYLKGGDSLFIQHPITFLTFLVPFSAFLWFIFEAINLKIQNWHYIRVPNEIWIRWPGNFLAFGTVLPGIFCTANLLEHYGIFRKNEFSKFFGTDLKKSSVIFLILGGFLMFFLSLIFPKYFFPLVWGCFVLMLDPVNALWKSKSLIQEWRQKNWNRTLQILCAGLICGGLWEFWNFWAGAKWVYSVPLPEFLLKNLKVFEMPLPGFLGFPPFALECFVMVEFVRNVRERVSGLVWKILVLTAFIFSVLMCHFMDRYTVKSFRKEWNIQKQETFEIVRI